MIVDALILAGGRSSRLGFSDKQKLQIDGVPLLDLTIQAVRMAGARTIVVVGDETRDGVVTVREQPAFAGPVAAIAAGLAASPGDAAALYVLACDMPRISAALPVLAAGFSHDGAIAVDDGRRQPLAVIVRPDALRRAIDGMPAVVDASMRDLLAGLDLADVAVPVGSTADIDTWESAAAFGATAPLTSGSTA